MFGRAVVSPDLVVSDNDGLALLLPIQPAESHAKVPAPIALRTCRRPIRRRSGGSASWLTITGVSIIWTAGSLRHASAPPASAAAALSARAHRQGARTNPCPTGVRRAGQGCSRAESPVAVAARASFRTAASNTSRRLG